MSGGIHKLTISSVGVGIICLSLILCGCIENMGDGGGKNNNTTNQNPEQISIQIFVGSWEGFEIQNQIPLNITFYSNNTGRLDEMEIGFEINGTILIIEMFNGETSSYYDFEFSENNDRLKLSNRYSNEIFELIKLK